MSETNIVKIIKVGLVSLLLTTAGVALAQNTTATSSVRDTIKEKHQEVKNIRNEARNEVRQMVASTTDKIKELRDERKAQVEVKLQEIKAKYQENRRARIAAYVEKIINRHNAAASRLDELAKRIGAHLTKLEAKKVKTTEARNLLVIAETKIQAAKDVIARIKPAADTALSATDVKAAFDIARQEISDSNQALRGAHAALVNVINSIKPGLNKTATTTPS